MRECVCVDVRVCMCACVCVCVTEREWREKRGGEMDGERISTEKAVDVEVLDKLYMKNNGVVEEMVGEEIVLEQYQLVVEEETSLEREVKFG